MSPISNSVGRLRRAGSSFGITCLLASSGTWAHEDHVQHPTHASDVVLLTFERAVSLGANRGPESTRASAPSEAANELSRVAAPVLTQLPYVQTQLGPRVSRGETSPEVIVSVVQPFTWGDTSGVQRRVAGATRKVVETHTHSARLMDAERAGHSWVDLALADAVLRLRQDYVEQALSLLALADARVAAGEGQPVESALAQSELAEARSLLIDAEGEHYGAELQLAYATGHPSSAHVDIQGQLPPPPPLTNPELEGDHPTVVAAHSKQELAQQQVHYAALQQAPTVSLGIQYQREGTGDQVLTAVATIPLPVGRPWAFQEAQQKVAFAQARAETLYVRQQTAVELNQSRHEITHSRSLFDHLEQAAIPPLREAHRLAVVRYRNGATDFTEVSLVRQRLLRAEEQLIRALANVHHAHLHLLMTTGQLTGTLLRQSNR